jgi:Resolvase, N terminal domain/Recombinase
MLNVYPHLKGRKAILDLRCSTTRQVDTSIPQQEEVGRAFCKANGVTVVRIITQEGVTATIPGARTDFDEILQRKKNGEDFDLLVMTDVSRFSRAGAKHGMSIEYELEVEGIEVVFATNPLPQGDDGDLVRPAYYFAAKMYSKGLAHSIARGSMAALEAGVMAHCNVAPFGLDFLYSIDGKPSHITRTLNDGRQLKLNPDAMGKNPRKDQILHVFPRNPKAGRNLHYRKQSYEKVKLVPGAPDALATVVEIFMLALQAGWGGPRIAGELNDRGVPAPRGGVWYDNTVNYILRNKTYLGVGIANMKTRAVYAARDATTPKVRNVTARTLAKRKKPPMEIRPRADWKEKQYPALAGLLGEELGPLAEQFIARSLAKKEGGYVPPEIPRNRHPDSDYFLTHILVSKQGGYRLGGYTVHAKGKRYRKYRITKFCHAPTRDPILNCRITAEPLENAVLGALGEILTAMPNQEARLAKAIRAEQKTRLKDHVERVDLVRERDELQDEYKDLIAMGRHGRELAKQKIMQLERQLDELEMRIRAANDAVGKEIDPTQQAAQIVKEFGKIFETLPSMPKPLLKQLAQLLITKLEIDLETLDFELELGLPSWAMIDAEGIKSALRLEPNPHMQTSAETQPQNGLILGRFACSASGQPICFDCRRLRRAA